MKLGDALCRVAAKLREQGDPARAYTVEHAMPVADAFPALLESCRQAAIMCAEYADGEWYSPVYARDCKRVGEVLENAISNAT